MPNLHRFPNHPVSGYTIPDMKTLVSALISDKKLTEEEKEFLLEYIKKK